MNLSAFSFLILAALTQVSPAWALGVNWAGLEDKLTGQRSVDFRRDLKRELARRVRLFPRSIKLYHYGNRGTVKYPAITYAGSSPDSKLRINYDEAVELKRGQAGTRADYDSPVELTPPESRTYFQAMTAQFEKGTQSWNVGPGLYAAVDPVQSESYMGNPGFLLEISVPQGMRYLDLRPLDGLVVSENFVRTYLMDEALQNVSDLRLNRIGANRFGLEIKRMIKLPKLRQALNDVLSELEVDVFAYAWSHHSYDACKLNSYNQEVAFNFMNPSALERGASLKTFVGTLDTSADAEKLAEYDRISDLIDSARIQTGLYLDQNGKRTMSSRDFSARILALGWSEVLKRESTYAKFIGNQADVELLKKVFVKHEVVSTAPSISYPEKFKNSSTYSDGQINDSLEYDPLKDLKANQKSEYETRISLIKNTVFGCDPKFPQENIPPEL